MSMIWFHGLGNLVNYFRRLGHILGFEIVPFGFSFAENYYLDIAEGERDYVSVVVVAVGVGVRCHGGEG
jgi:hypothetical protein